MKATAEYVETFKAAGLSEAQGVKYLNEEQKEAYEFGKFKEAQEKRYTQKQEVARKIANKPTNTAKPAIKSSAVKEDDEDGYDDADDDFEQE